MAIQPSALIAKFNQAKNEKWGYIWGTAGEQWTAAKQNALVQKFINKYGPDWKNNEDAKDEDKYRGALNGSKWIGHTVADCSGLFSWAFKLLGGYIYHGSNTIWKSYCTDKGELTKKGRTDGKPLKPGTAVFTGNETNKGHIGLYVGNNLVIEASGTNAGVITTTISGGKWTYWGELKGVAYEKDGDDVMVPVIEPTYPTLKRGNKGNYVKTLQTMLKSLGYDLGSYGIDGDFGKATETAVKSFQQNAGLTVDGIVGSKTWAALKQQPVNNQNGGTIQYVTVHIPKCSASVAEELMKKYPGSWTTNE